MTKDKNTKYVKTSSPLRSHLSCNAPVWAWYQWGKLCKMLMLPPTVDIRQVLASIEIKYGEMATSESFPPEPIGTRKIRE